MHHYYLKCYTSDGSRCDWYESTKELCFPNPLANENDVFINGINVGSVEYVEHSIYPDDPSKDSRSTAVLKINDRTFFKGEKMAESLDGILRLSYFEMIDPKK